MEEMNMRIPQFLVGTKCIVQKVITRNDTALNFGSGALTDLLATPTLVALMIEASVKAADPKLPEGYITIGKTIEVEHNHPSREGMTVTVSAEIIEQYDTKLVFEIKAYDELGQIGGGKHERLIVEQEALNKKVKDRCSILDSKKF
jgi:predicted thioesterase